MDNSVIVSLRDIVVEFDGQRILDGLNLDIHDKEFVTLLGSSGCGKTTTLRIIGRLSGAQSGPRLASKAKDITRRAALQAPGEHGVPEIRPVSRT